MNGSEEMELLLSDHEVKINGKKVIVHKFPMLSGIRLTSKLSKIVGKSLSDENTSNAIDTAVRAMIVNGDTDEDTKGFRIFGIRTLLEILGDDLVDIIADVIEKSTNLDENDVEEISLEDGLDLLFDIYEVNKGFFTKFTKKLQKLNPQSNEGDSEKSKGKKKKE